ncbi:MAG: hypothetical protein IKV81_07585, partial [Clostridia bacterium]|nr:hypothetical protein [Clostridia bacterium]
GENSQASSLNSTASGESKPDNSKGNASTGTNQTNNSSKNDKTESTENSSTESKTETVNNSMVTNSNSSNQSTQNNPSKNDTTTSTNSTISKNTLTEKIDNGVLENAKAEKMDVPENMKLLATDDAKEENKEKTVKATVGFYELDGDVVNWTTENDLIYVITKGNNRLVVLNSKSMMAVANVPLAGKPAEINLIGDKIYISLPDLCRIDVFSKSNFKKTSSLYFDHEVSSFCIDGNYIYYSEHDQHCRVFRKNLTTNELTQILPDSGFSFGEPKLYLNKQDNILYIGETDNSGCVLFYYDATTLQLKSKFKKNNYGMWNHTRDIFHIGDEIFWGNYRFSDTNAKEIIGRYGEGEYGSVNFASKEVVSTYEGLYLTDTYECIINYFDDDFPFEYVLVTKSNNVFFRDRDFDANIIVGVNFGVQ